MAHTLEPLLPTLLLVAWAGLGAFMLYALNRLNDRQPFSLFKVLNIDVGTQGKTGAILGDMIVSSVLGALVVCVLTSPDTNRQAIAAGLGMTGILSAAAKR